MVSLTKGQWHKLFGLKDDKGIAQMLGQIRDLSDAEEVARRVTDMVSGIGIQPDFANLQQQQQMQQPKQPKLGDSIMNAQLIEQNTVSPATLVGLLDLLSAANEPLFIWGSPGIGKSDSVRQLAKRKGAYLLDIRASQWDASDTRGIPFVHDGKTHWAVPAVLPSEELAEQYPMVIVFLDELNTAAQSVAASLYQLVLDRQLGDYVLPDNCYIVAAGNKETDRAIANKMSTALADRFFHCTLEVDVPAWREWAIGEDLHTAVISYASGFKEEHLHYWDPKNPSKAQPTPRGWEKVSRVIKQAEQLGVNSSVERAAVIGKVGDMVGTEFLGYLKLYRELREPAEYIEDPELPLPTEHNIAYALGAALAKKAIKKTLPAVIRVAERLGDEFGKDLEVFIVDSLRRRDESLMKSKAFINWATNNAQYLI